MPGFRLLRNNRKDGMEGFHSRQKSGLDVCRQVKSQLRAYG